MSPLFIVAYHDGESHFFRELPNRGTDFVLGVHSVAGGDGYSGTGKRPATLQAPPPGSAAQGFDNMADASRTLDRLVEADPAHSWYVRDSEDEGLLLGVLEAQAAADQERGERPVPGFGTQPQPEAPTPAPAVSSPPFTPPAFNPSGDSSERPSN